MGYCIEVTGYQFHILRNNFMPILQHLCEMSWEALVERVYNGGWCGLLRPMIAYRMYEGLQHDEFFQTDRDQQWFLLDAFAAGCRWEFHYSPERYAGGSVDPWIMGISFTGQKAGGEGDFLHEIAPWVESGSYIQFQGEDGARWVYRFQDGKVQMYDIKVDTTEIPRLPQPVDIHDTEDTMPRGR